MGKGVRSSPLCNMEIKILKINENNSPEDLRKLVAESVQNDEFTFFQISNVDLFMLLRHACYHQFKIDQELIEKVIDTIKEHLLEQMEEIPEA